MSRLSLMLSLTVMGMSAKAETLGLRGPAVQELLQMQGAKELPAAPAAAQSFSVEQPAQSVLVLDFDAANPSDESVSAEAYLKAHGIALSDKSDGTKVEIFREGASVAPSNGRRNIMAQRGPQKPVYFTLTFDKPIKSFAFSRPKLIAGPKHGITHPIWAARAYDEKDREIIQNSRSSRRELDPTQIPSQYFNQCVERFMTRGSLPEKEHWILPGSWGHVGECMISSYEDVRPRRFVLTGGDRGIKSLRIDSFNGEFAAFVALLIDGIDIEP